MSDTADVIIVKMVLVGQMAVGKSNMVSKYVKDEFSTEYISTNGVSYEHNTIFIEEYNKTLEMHIWDTAGQERFRSLSRLYYKDVKAAILVYDVTRRETLEELKKYWYQEVLNNTPEGIVLGVAANKSDLILDSQVPESEGIEFAKSIGAIFRNTSALSGDGLEDLFYCMGRKIINPRDEPEPPNPPSPPNSNDIFIIDPTPNPNPNPPQSSCC